MKKLLTLLCLILLAGCDGDNGTGNGPGTGQSATHTYWPYKPGDMYAQIDAIGFLTEPFVFASIQDTTIHGKIWSMHVANPHPQLTTEHSPEPYQRDTAFYRVDGDLLYSIRWKDSIVFNFGAERETDPGFIRATRGQDLGVVTVPAGAFDNCILFNAPTARNFQRIAFSPNVGWIYSISNLSGKYELHSARINGKQYP